MRITNRVNERVAPRSRAETTIAERDKPGFSAPAMVRVSMGMYNTEDEIDTLIEAVRTIAGA